MIETDQAKLEFREGLSSGAVLPFALRFFEKTDLQVYMTSGGVATLLSQDVDYTIADSSSYEHGANVTLQIDPPSGAVVTVKRVLPVTQGLELPNHGKLPTESLEKQLDHITMVQQQQSEELERAFKVPIGGSATVIPDPEHYADYANYAGYANAAGSAGRAGVAEALDGGVVVNSAGHATSAAGLDVGVIVDSAGHATKAGGLDAGVVVDSAGHATAAAGLDAGVVVDSAGHATKAAGLDDNVVVVSASSATKLGGATKAQILASASNSTVSSASSCTYLGGATKQQVIDSAVASAGGGGGSINTAWGSLAPDYGGTQLTPGTTYQTEADGTLRISLRDIPSNMSDGCFTISINGYYFGMYQFKANSPGQTWFIHLTSGTTFNIPTVYNASVLVMYDKGTHVYDD